MSGEMNPILECRNLSKKYNHQTYALNDLSLSLGRGQIVGLLGPNGSGKNYPDQADQRAFDPFRRFCADRRHDAGRGYEETDLLSAGAPATWTIP